MCDSTRVRCVRLGGTLAARSVCRCCAPYLQSDWVLPFPFSEGGEFAVGVIFGREVDSLQINFTSKGYLPIYLWLYDT